MLVCDVDGDCDVMCLVWRERAQADSVARWKHISLERERVEGVFTLVVDRKQVATSSYNVLASAGDGRRPS